MNDHLRERIIRKLESLSDERGYQVLDYVEFLESKYAEKTAPGASAFTRFAETVEDTMRAGKISAATIGETMGLLNRAVGVLNGAMAAGKSMAGDIMTAAQRAGGPGGANDASAGSGTPPTGGAPGASTGPATPGSTGEQST